MLSPAPQIVCFVENEGTESNPLGTISTRSIKLDKIGSPLVALASLPANAHAREEVPQHKVLAIHENGLVSCYPADLAVEEWHTYIKSTDTSKSNIRVRKVTLCSLEEARQTILKDRQDVLASLGSAEEPLNSSLLMVTICSSEENSCTQGKVNIRVMGIEEAESKPTELSLSQSQRIRELLSLCIPNHEFDALKDLETTIHIPSGSLYLSTPGCLYIYELSGAIPQLSQKLNMGSNAIASSLRLSSNLLAYDEANTVSIIELPFCSIQAELNLDKFFERRSKSNKAKIELLSYFAPLDLLIIREDRHLFAAQLENTIPSIGESRKRKRNGSLINSISQGSSSLSKTAACPTISSHHVKSLGTYLDQRSMSKKEGQNHKLGLEQCVDDNDVAAFELKAASLLGLENLDGRRPLVNKKRQTPVDPDRERLLLSTIFSVAKLRSEDESASEDGSLGLRFRIFAQRLCEYFIQTGTFTLHSLETSLKHAGSLSPSLWLAKDALIHVLVEQDSGLYLLAQLTGSRISMSTAEIVITIAFIIRDSNPVEKPRSQKLLTDGNEESKEKTNLQMQLQSGDITQCSSPRHSVVTYGDDGHRILAAAMRRLYAIPTASVVQNLKQTLTTVQLRSLVDALRLEIARNGWLSPYKDKVEDTNIESNDNDRICHIAHLLSCTIDAIGTGGWVLSTPLSDDFSETADTIAYMKAEISAALEGIEENTYLKGMLGELLLCGKDSLRPSWKQSGNRERQGADGNKKPITISLGEEPKILPLGLKTGTDLSFTKVGAGGELLKRSARDIGRQKSRMVGKYSFERIVI